MRKNSFSFIQLSYLGLFIYFVCLIVHDFLFLAQEKKNQKDRNNNNRRPVAGMIDIRSGKLLEISFRWLVEDEKIIDNM